MFVLPAFIFVTIACFTVQGAPTSCPKVDGADSVYIPHEDCTKFWQCSNGTPYLFDCPANLHFNPKRNVCDWPEDAGCTGSSSNSSSESNGSEGTGSEEDTPPNSKPESDEENSGSQGTDDDSSSSEELLLLLKVPHWESFAKNIGSSESSEESNGSNQESSGSKSRIAKIDETRLG